MKRTLIGVLAVLPVLTMANEYHKNLQVFTANTARIPCKTTPALVYKGDRIGYAKEIAKARDKMVEGALDSGQLIATNALAYGAADGLAAGAIAGLAVMAIKGIHDAATSDYEYLYVTECNSGSKLTRLMTLVVSNEKLSESQWISIAKKDQARSR